MSGLGLAESSAGMQLDTQLEQSSPFIVLFLSDLFANESATASPPPPLAVKRKKKRL